MTAEAGCFRLIDSATNSDTMPGVEGGRSVAVDGHDHFQAWFRITQQVGGVVEILALRDGKRVTSTMKIVE